MMTGPLSIGRPSGNLPVFSARHLRIGFVVVGMRPLDREGHESDERRPDREQVEIKCWYSKKPGCLIEDEQERRRKNHRPEHEKANKKLAGTAGSQHRLTRGCANDSAPVGRLPKPGRMSHRHRWRGGANVGNRIATRFPWAEPHCPSAFRARPSTASTRAMASLVENGFAMVPSAATAQHVL